MSALARQMPSLIVKPAAWPRRVLLLHENLEFGGDLDPLVEISGMYADPYINEDDEGWQQPGLFSQGGRKWTTRGTKISSEPKI